MHEALFRFLIKNKQISLPGIGTIVLRTHPAESEFVNRSFRPPSYTFSFEKVNNASSEKLISWIAKAENVDVREAELQLNDFLSHLKHRLESGKKAIWNGVGTFHKDDTGEINFEATKNELPFLEEVVAEKVLRENAEHTMLVGEIEKTSTQMTEILSGDFPTRPRQSRWWVWPLATIVIILLFLGWYFSQHGISSSSTGNNHKVSISPR